MPLNEKGFYFTIFMYALISAISLQKSVRDRLEGGAVTAIYFGLCWFSIGLSILMLLIGLWNASLSSSEKGFYAMAFLLSLFAAVAIQKNVRDVASLGGTRTSLTPEVGVTAATGRERPRYDPDGQHSQQDGRHPHPAGRGSHPDGELPFQAGSLSSRWERLPYRWGPSPS